MEAAGKLAAMRKGDDTTRDMALIQGGAFLMGTDDGMPDEGPAHQAMVKSFWMDTREVTVAEFVKFVEATGYQTEAERFGWSGVFNLKAGEWQKTGGADWRHPDGPDSSPNPNEPAV